MESCCKNERFVCVCLLVTVSGTWSVVNTTGAVVKGSYGHSSVYDDQNGVILVHGGYHSMSAATYLLTDALYEFNPNTSAWYVLAKDLTALQGLVT